MAQLGTIKLQTDSGIVDVPVFDVGDSGGSTSEALRVQTDSGIGFVPLVDPADAATPQEAIRVQTDSGIKAVNDSATFLTTAPDSANLRGRYDARTLSLSNGDPVTTWPDQTSNGNDLTVNANGTAPTYRDVANSTLGSVPSVDFNGVDNALIDSFNSTVSTPYTVFLLGKYNVREDFSEFWAPNPEPSSGFIGLLEDSGNDYIYGLVGSTGGTVGGSVDTNPHVLSCLIRSSSGDLREDGSDIGTASFNSSTASIDGVSLASRPDVGNIPGDVEISEFLVYDIDESANETQIESHLDRDTAII